MMSRNVDPHDLPKSTTRVGVISDTHGLLRPEALAVLKGSDLILHAGDIGGMNVVRGLEQIAPVRIVRGNTDREPWSSSLPLTDVVELPGAWLYMLHELQALALDPSAGGFSVVVFGHSHKPSMETRNGVLYFNPGSAGPRRFRLPVSVGKLTVRDGIVTGALVRLEVT